MNIEEIVVVDLETSGLNPDRHGILEIGAKRLVTGEEFQTDVRLSDAAVYDPSVYAINGITEKMARDSSRPKLLHALSAFSTWLGDAQVYMAGSNPKFDDDFLWETALYSHWPFKRHLIGLQTAALTHFMLKGIALPASLSADAIYPLLGMAPEPKPHRAIRGARWEVEAFRRAWGMPSDFNFDANGVLAGVEVAR